MRLLGNRLGRVLLDAWFMRGRLILVAEGHTVIGRVRRDRALDTVPRPPRRTRGRPRKYGERVTLIEALPLQRSAPILSGNLEVVRYRTARVSARFLKGRVRVGAARTPRPPGQADRGTPADLHRSRSPGH